ncbi:uncharacterized protein LOC105420069 [Amborella trichopoda]|uniref:uncharacterized protein LOC105420069 n=1 Tax=Amborella trichopoda TaxID=13333 RepID=UPI0005D431CC|nr:uncharacterized protein LOC105420069 [Amborella trichopoda]|eukprot:XP_011620522.1 uncharacterized protein LOC105420069 [Amborella trichopoda]
MGAAIASIPSPLSLEDATSSHSHCASTSVTPVSMPDLGSIVSTTLQQVAQVLVAMGFSVKPHYENMTYFTANGSPLRVTHSGNTNVPDPSGCVVQNLATGKVIGRKFNKNIVCESCKLAKHLAQPFPHSNNRSIVDFALVHSDVWGPAPVPSINGFSYYVIFINDFSKSMNEEIVALKVNHTWDLVPLPLEKHPISSKLVYKVKLRADDTLDRHKARLVAQGYAQEHDNDYEENFAPVAKITTIRTFIALASIREWPIWYALDLVSTAHLNDVKVVDTPMELNVKLSAYVRYPLLEPTLSSTTTSISSYRILRYVREEQEKNTVSKSSTEAEYRAMSSIASEIVWVRALLNEFGISTSNPTPLYANNQSVIKIASNPVFHERIKHITVDCHYVCDRYLDGTLSLPYVSSTV